MEPKRNKDIFENEKMALELGLSEMEKAFRDIEDDIKKKEDKVKIPAEKLTEINYLTRQGRQIADGDILPKTQNVSPEFQFESPEPKIIKSEDQIEEPRVQNEKNEVQNRLRIPQKYLATKIKEAGLRFLTQTSKLMKSSWQKIKNVFTKKVLIGTASILATLVTVFILGTLFINYTKSIDKDISDNFLPYEQRKAELAAAPEEILEVPKNFQELINNLSEFQLYLQNKSDSSLVFKNKYQVALQNIDEYLRYENANLIKMRNRDFNEFLSSKLKNDLQTTIVSHPWYILVKKFTLNEAMVEEQNKWLFSQLRNYYQHEISVSSITTLLKQTYNVPSMAESSQAFLKDINIFQKSNWADDLRLMQDALLRSDENNAKFFADRLKNENYNQLSKASANYLRNALEYSQNNYWHILLDDANAAIKKSEFLKASHYYEQAKTLARGDFGKYKEYADKIAKQLATNNVAETEPYLGPILSFQVKPLIQDFISARNSAHYRHLANHHMTAKSFAKFLKTMYDSNYILVDEKSFFDTRGKKLTLRLPKGKKPLLLYLQDFMLVEAKYSQYFASAFSLENDKLNFYKHDKNALNEELAFQVLEEFIKAHPDFSFENARASFMLEGEVLKPLGKTKYPEIWQKLAANYYGFTVSTNSLALPRLNSASDLKIALNEWQNKNGVKPETYFFSLGERARANVDVLRVLKENRLGLHVYLTDKPEKIEDEKFLALGLLDLRPYTLYKNQFAAYFDGRAVYDELVKEGHFVGKRR